MKVRIFTWNVNSVRARMENVLHFIENYNPDVLLLQETKCTNEHFPIEAFNLLGYNVIHKGQKSYNGVAILSKYIINEESVQIIQNNEARYIECLITISAKVFRIASVYIPRGGEDPEPGENLLDSEKFQYKLNFFDSFVYHICNNFSPDEYIILGGDYNVAHNEIDLHSPKSAKGKVGFHDLERSKMSLIQNAKYFDLFRSLYPDKQEYTWWDYRRDAWKNNKGWRIDYFFVNQKVFELNPNCIIHSKMRSLEKPSDHAPVEIEINL